MDRIDGESGHVGGGAEDEVDEEDDGDGDAADADGGGDPVDAFGWGVKMRVAVGAEGGERGDIGAAVAAVGDGALFDVAGVAEDGKEGAQDEADEQGHKEQREDSEHGKTKADEAAAAGFVAGHAPGLDGFGRLHEVTLLTGLTGYQRRLNWEAAAAMKRPMMTSTAMPMIWPRVWKKSHMIKRRVCGVV